MAKVQGIENKRVAEFQVIISVDFDDGRLYPLTESIPECLLPISNQKLLFYQLYQLEKCGATEVMIITPDDYKSQISSALVEFISETMSVELLAVDDREYQGSADCLRFIANRIRGEFIFISSDILCKIDFAELVNMHRINATDVTMALYGLPIEEPEKKGGKRKIRIEDQDQEYIGITNQGRVVLKFPLLEIENNLLNISKPLLHRDPFTVRTDLIDSGVYVFSKWIIDFLLNNDKILNIRTDLIPLLIQRQYQYQSKEYFMETMPSLLMGRSNKHLYVLDKWLVNQKLLLKQFEIISLQQQQQQSSGSLMSTIGNQLSSTSAMTTNNQIQTVVPVVPFKRRYKELCDFVLDEINIDDSSLNNSLSSMNMISHKNNINATLQSSFDNAGFDDNNSHEKSPESMIMNAQDNENDLLRCYAFVCEYSTNYSNGLLQRLTTIHSYLNLNKEIPIQTGPYSTQVKNYQKKESSVVGDGIELGEKAVYKQCSIGKKCVIGSKTKLNNCVVMDNVKIGDGCTIQNTVICSNVVIESNCSLNDCRVGYSAVVPSGSKVKDEDISSS